MCSIINNYIYVLVANGSVELVQIVSVKNLFFISLFLFVAVFLINRFARFYKQIISISKIIISKLIRPWSILGRLPSEGNPNNKDDNDTKEKREKARLKAEAEKKKAEQEEWERECRRAEKKNKAKICFLAIWFTLFVISLS